MDNQKTLLVVAGPTAIGKTNLAIQLAQKHSTDIVSADSRQFYREMNIGTAKPSTVELEVVKHHLINNLSINNSYSAGQYERDALGILDTLFKTKDVAVLTGGSGLYIDALCNGIDDFPVVSKEIREELKLQFTENGIEYLKEELQKVDADYFEKVDLHNPVRIIRALEIYRQTGENYTHYLSNKQKPKLRPFKIKYFCLTMNRENLYQRINGRVDSMIEQGLVDEVKKLIPFQDNNALQTVGYKELFSHFNGKASLDEAVDQIKKNTRNYAKRQLTWFRRNPNYQWIDLDKASGPELEMDL